MTYAELHCHSNFSFLDGASHPAELARRGGELGLSALAITDTGGVYGAVRFLAACRDAGLHGVIGACLEVDPPHEIRTPGYPPRSVESGAPRLHGDPG